MIEAVQVATKAKAFFSEKYSQAVGQAKEFAGENGRLATLPDIIDARIATPLGEIPWEQYFCTNSSEYFGFTTQRNPIIVVAHGVGPLSTAQGLEKAYKSRLKPERSWGGRISQRDFLKLEDGQMGEVTIVDFRSYQKRYQYPLLQSLRADEAMVDPLVRARLGERTDDYLLIHNKENLIWLKEEKERISKGEVVNFGIIRKRPIEIAGLEIIQVEDPSNNSYGHKTADEAPLAHSLGIGQIMIMNGDSLHTQIYCREHADPTRVVGINGDGPIANIESKIIPFPSEVLTKAK